MSRIRLVSFLGIGPYRSTCYSLDGVPPKPADVADKALCQLLDKVDSAVLLGTQDALLYWEEKRPLDEYLGNNQRILRELPRGASEEDRWAIFQKTVEALSADPIADAGETEAPEEIVVNVTNGFRAHPILGMAAVSFMLSEWARKEIKKQPRLRVLYGAYEPAKNPPDDNSPKPPTPIWDLTEFVTVSRWNSALDALMRYGRADDLAQIAEQDGAKRLKAANEQGKTSEERSAEGFVKQLGQAAKAFADDLALARLRDLFTESAPKLAKVLEQNEMEPLLSRLPLLSGTVTQLRDEWVKPLCAKNVLGREGLQATAALAERYGKLQRFAEQAATIREGLVTHYAHLTGRPAPPEPGQASCKPIREIIDTSWGAITRTHGRSEGSSEPRALVENAKLGSAVVQLRNDIEHCGINSQPREAKKLRPQLTKYTESFSKLVATLDSIALPVAPVFFLNLSNHPLTRWPAGQVEAARALGLGEPRDLEGGLAEIDPEDDEKKVAAVAKEVAERAVAQRAAGAFVAGEYSLTVALIGALQKKGVRCFAAASRREVVEAEAAGEARERTLVYRFVRFREYPREE